LPDLESLARAVERRLDWGLQALARLVAADSVAPREAACQESLADLLREEGLDPRLIPLPEERLRRTEGFVETGLLLADRPNLLVSLGAGEPGARSLILNSHADTVSWEGEANAWSVPALSGVLRDGRLFGRGSVDAKGQIIAACMALLALRDAGQKPPGRVTLQSAVDEEPGGNGTLAACLEGPLADAAIVLEPTGNHVAFGHRGIIGLRVVISEQAGHGAVAGAESQGAIVRAAEIVRALAAALADWSSPADAAYGPPSVNVGRIAGGEDIFTTPQRCLLEAGVRYAPGAEGALLEAIGRATAPLGVTWNDPAASARAEVFSHYDAAETPVDHPLVEGLLGAARRFCPDSRLVTFPGGCDARHFINRFGVPAVIFGPGELAAAHAVDEAMPVDQLLAAAQTLACFIADWCRRPLETEADPPAPTPA
jgi:acetylornithine deacetylase